MLSIYLLCVAAASLVAGRAYDSASSFAGSTSTAVFPPSNFTATTDDPNFPDGSHVGFAGPTPSIALPVPLSPFFLKAYHSSRRRGCCNRDSTRISKI
jgi:hypothetical protein